MWPWWCVPHCPFFFCSFKFFFRKTCSASGIHHHLLHCALQPLLLCSAFQIRWKKWTWVWIRNSKPPIFLSAGLRFEFETANLPFSSQLLVKHLNNVTCMCLFFNCRFLHLIIDLQFSRTTSVPKQMTNLRVPLKRSDGREQWQNPCNTKRLLFSARDSSHI